jgi:hypothetical protein
MTDKPAIAALLASGRIDYETPTGWRTADLGLRGEVIEAALKIQPADTLHAALLKCSKRKKRRKRHVIQFRDDEIGLTVRWSPE